MCNNIDSLEKFVLPFYIFFSLKSIEVIIFWGDYKK